MYNILRAAKRRTIILSLLVLFVLLVSACGGQQQASNTSQQNNAASSNTSDTDTDAEKEQPEEPQELKKVTVAIAVNNLATAPFFVAEELGFFEEEGIDYNPIAVDGSGPAIQALVGGSAQFAYTGSSTVTQAHQEGVDILAVTSAVSGLTMDFVISNSTLEKLDVTPDSPIEDRLKALKGLTLGVTGAGSPTDTYIRYYLTQAGLDPNEDARILAIGAPPAMAAALKQGQIDAFHITPPLPQQIEAEGYGTILISPTSDEIPGIEDLVYAALITRKSYADANEDTVRRVARAVARGNNFVLDHPEEALDILQRKHFSNVEPDILKAAFESVSRAVPRDGKMSEQGWINEMKIDKLSGALKKDLDASEGVMWTNKYVDDVNGQSK